MWSLVFVVLVGGGFTWLLYLVGKRYWPGHAAKVVAVVAGVIFTILLFGLRAAFVDWFDFACTTHRC